MRDVEGTESELGSTDLVFFLSTARGEGRGQRGVLGQSCTSLVLAGLDNSSSRVRDQELRPSTKRWGSGCSPRTLAARRARLTCAAQDTGGQPITHCRTSTAIKMPPLALASNDFMDGSPMRTQAANSLAQARPFDDPVVLQRAHTNFFFFFFPLFSCCSNPMVSCR